MRDIFGFLRDIVVYFLPTETKAAKLCCNLRVQCIEGLPAYFIVLILK